MNDKRKKLYQGLVEEGLYSKSYEEFENQFSNPESRRNLYGGLVDENLYSKGYEDFEVQFFSDLQKKNPDGTSSTEFSTPSPTGSPQADVPTAAGSSKLQFLGRRTPEQVRGRLEDVESALTGKRGENTEYGNLDTVQFKSKRYNELVETINSSDVLNKLKKAEEDLNKMVKPEDMPEVKRYVDLVGQYNKNSEALKEMLKEIEGAKPTTKEEEVAINNKINTYNQMVSESKTMLEEIDKLDPDKNPVISKYNKSVSSYNALVDQAKNLNLLIEEANSHKKFLEPYYQELDATPPEMVNQPQEQPVDGIEVFNDRRWEPAKNLIKSFWGPLKYDIPATIASSMAAMGPEDYESLRMRNPEWFDKHYVPKLQEKHGDAWEKGALNELKETRSEILRWALDRSAKGAEYKRELIQSWDDVNDPIDLLNFISSAVGQSMAQIPVNVATAGASGIGQSIGGIYMDEVQKLAKDYEITPEEVIDRELDDQATAIAFGFASGALDKLGADKVLGGLSKAAVGKALRTRAKDMLGVVGNAAFEGLTEAAQSVIEQTGASIGAGEKPEIDLKQVRDEATMGVFGGGAISAATTVAKYKQLKEQEKTTKPPQPGSKPTTEQPETRTEPPPLEQLVAAKKKAAENKLELGAEVEYQGKKMKVVDEQMREDETIETVTLQDEEGNEFNVTPEKFYAETNKELAGVDPEALKVVDMIEREQEKTAPPKEPGEVKVYTNENIDQIATDNPNIPFLEPLVNAFKAVEGVKSVIIHPNDDSFQAAVGGIGAGAFKGGEVHINAQRINSTTGLHEAVTPIAAKLATTNPDLLNNFYDQIRNSDAYEGLKDFEALYEDDMKKEEVVTEYLARVASGQIDVTPTVLEQIKAFIQSILDKVGLNVFDINLNDETDIRFFAGKLADSLKTGGKIDLDQMTDVERNQLDPLWHGSPHDFNQFTTKAMGTGEGAQAFGWGLYFTDQESIGRYYADRLTRDKVEEEKGGVDEIEGKRYLYKVKGFKGKKQYKQLGNKVWPIVPGVTDDPVKTRQAISSGELKPVKEFETAEEASKWVAENNEYNLLEWNEPIKKEQHNKIKEQFDKEFGDLHESPLPKMHDPVDADKLRKQLKEVLSAQGQVKKDIDQLLKKHNRVNGSDLYGIYETRHTRTVSEAADLVEPVSSDDAAKLRELDSEFNRLNEERRTINESLANNREVQGRNIYQSLVTFFGDEVGMDYNEAQKQASMLLLRAGIDGNKLPAGSMGRGDGSKGFNYVIFDEMDVEVEEKIRFQKIKPNTGIDLWHGGPHDFNQFTTKAMGTGEGTQMEGWGLYFTSSEEIARYYANKEAKKRGRGEGSRILYKAKGFKGVDEYNILEYDKPIGKKAYDSVMNRVEKEFGDIVNYEDLFPSGEKVDVEMDRLMEKYDEVVAHINRQNKMGFGYEDARPFLDIKGKINRRSRYLRNNPDGISSEKVTGEDMHLALFSLFLNNKDVPVHNLIEDSPDKDASMLLLRSGINGFQFDAVEGKYGDKNYVIFDEMDVEVDEKIRFQKIKPNTGIDLWHGSPHDFNQFTTKAMGTGEGAQVQGWGLYFTEIEEVGRWYAERLSNPKARAIEHIKDRMPDLNEEQVEWLSNFVVADKKKYNDLNSIAHQALLENNDIAVSVTSGKSQKDMSELIRGLSSTLKSNILYKARAFKGKDDYDLIPFHEQMSDRHYEKIKKQFNSEFGDIISYDEMVKRFAQENNITADKKGGFVYLSLTDFFNNTLDVESDFRVEESQKNASMLMLRAGINGIMYPTGSMNDGDSKGFNYVIFDEMDVEVEEKIRFQRTSPDKVKAKNVLKQAFENGAINPQNRNQIINYVAQGFNLQPSDVDLLMKRIESGPRYVKAPRAIRNSRQMEGLAAFHSKYLSGKRGVPAKVQQLREQRSGSIVARVEAASNRAKKLGKMAKKSEFPEIDKLLRGQTTYANSPLRTEIKDLVVEMRQDVDNLSQTLLDEGYIEQRVLGTRTVAGTVQQINSLNAMVQQIQSNPNATANDKRRAGLYKKKAGELQGKLDDIQRQRDNIENNLGTYLTRAYEIYDNKDWKPSEQVYEAAIQFTMTDKNMTYDEAKDLTDKILKEKKVAIGNKRKGKEGSKDPSILKQREDVPEPIRALYGEYTDPLQAYAETVFRLSSYIENARFLNDFRDIGLGFFVFEESDPSKPPYDDITKISAKGNESMAPLDGLWTYDGIYEALGGGDGAVRFTGPWAWINWFNAAINWNKTVGSYQTHARNVIGNIPFMLGNGYFLSIDPRTWGNPTKAIAKAFRAVGRDATGKYGTKGDKYDSLLERLKQNGVIGQNLTTNMIDDILSSDDIPERLYRRRYNKRRGIFQRGKRIGKNAIEVLNTAYGAEDDFFKVTAYILEADQRAQAYFNKPYDQLTADEKAEVDEEAMEIVKNVLPNYSRIGKAIKTLSTFPLVGNFVSFASEALRVSYNTADLSIAELRSTNPKIRAIGGRRIINQMMYSTFKASLIKGIAAAIGATTEYVFHTAPHEVFGLGDDEDKEEERAVREFMWRWVKNNDLAVLSIDKGVIRVQDISATDPHGNIVRTKNAIRMAQDKTKIPEVIAEEVLLPFFDQSILMQYLEAMKDGTDTYGKQLTRSTAPAYEKAQDAAMFTIRTIGPTSINSAMKLLEGKGTLLGQMFGNTYNIDINRDFRYKIADYTSYKSGGDKEGIREKASEIFNSDRTDEEKQAWLDQLNTEREASLNKLKVAYQRALLLEADPKTLRDMLKKALDANEERYVLYDSPYRPLTRRDITIYKK